MSRRTRHDIRAAYAPVHRKNNTGSESRITRQEAQAALNRIFKREAVARGIIDPDKGKFRFQWHYDGRTGEVEANTRSEARGLVKRVLGIPRSERLPIGLALYKVGVTEGRDVPVLAVIGTK